VGGKKGQTRLFSQKVQKYSWFFQKEDSAKREFFLLFACGSGYAILLRCDIARPIRPMQSAFGGQRSLVRKRLGGSCKYSMYEGARDAGENFSDREVGVDELERFNLGGM